MRNRIHDEPVGDPFRGPAFGERTDPTVIGIGSIISAVGAGASALSAIGGLMGKKTPAAPQVAAPTVMPEPDDAAAKAAKRRSLAEQSQRQGRQSTILSDSVTSDILG